MLEILLGSVAAALMLAGAAYAQPAKTQRSAALLECSRQADDRLVAIIGGRRMRPPAIEREAAYL
jgi:hypothetical protein